MYQNEDRSGKWTLFITMKCWPHVPDEWNWVCGESPQPRDSTCEHIPFSQPSWPTLTLTHPADGKERYLPRKKIPRKAKVSFSLRSRTESWSNWSFPDIFRELSVLKQEQPQRDFRKNGMPEKPFAYCRLCSNKCSCLRLILSNPPPSEKPFTHGTAKPEMGNVRGLHSWFTCCYWTN